MLVQSRRLVTKHAQVPIYSNGWLTYFSPGRGELAEFPVEVFLFGDYERVMRERKRLVAQEVLVETAWVEGESREI